MIDKKPPLINMVEKRSKNMTASREGENSPTNFYFTDF